MKFQKLFFFVALLAVLPGVFIQAAKADDASEKAIPVNLENADFSRLDPTKHMFVWFFDKPYEVLWIGISEILQEQVPGSSLNQFQVTSDPEWLTVGSKQTDNENLVTVVRSAVAFEFSLVVETPNGKTESLSGVFGVAGANLNQSFDERRFQSWLDLNGQLKEFGSNGLLYERMESLMAANN